MQRDYTDRVQRKKDALVPLVFHRSGKAITAFTKAWRAACVAAWMPGTYSSRPATCARAQLGARGRAGACGNADDGHKTRSVFERYNIVSEGDLFDAARRYEDGVARIGPRAQALSAERGF